MEPAAAPLLDLRDHSPDTASLLAEVRAGLTARPRTLPSKLFYDEEGSRLFDAITELDEYYPTRTEVGILETHAAAISDAVGQNVVLVEYGSGSSLKTDVLLRSLSGALSYVPIDISREHLMQSAARLAAKYPNLEVTPVAADYTGSFTLPESARRHRVIVFFPGSTVGNFVPKEAVLFLEHIREVIGENGGLLIGVDLRKDVAVLEPAYNDAQGVTAAFNLNVLRRINRDLGADFVLDAFEHRAFFNEQEGRIEMHLISRADQEVHIEGETFPIAEGASICTEYSYKYTLEGFRKLAEEAGLAVTNVWTDDRAYFSVQFLTPQRG